MDPELLRRISIPIPCDKPWSQMRGDDRVRFCGLCKKSVTNLSAMRAGEIGAFLLSSSGPKCVRFYRRPDGTVLTSDCTPTWRTAKRKAAAVLAKRRFPQWLPAGLVGAILSWIALVIFVSVFSQNIRAMFAARAGQLVGIEEFESSATPPNGNRVPGF